ncbi:MAG: hypothetical protein JXR91_16110 [Deltaproteobacteria bacterium]|nr:hypothetical protein [Deltaproteobacteria bacterium]
MNKTRTGNQVPKNLSFLMQLVLFVSILSVSNNLFADVTENSVVADIPQSVADDGKTGWSPRLKLNGNFFLGQTSNVPGVADGLSFAFGYLVDTGVDYLSSNKNHEWRNSLIWELGFTKTPSIDMYLKSLDKIDFTTEYLFHFPKLRMMGLFARGRVSTSMLKSYEVRTDPTDVIRLDSGQELDFDINGNPIDSNGNIIDAAHPDVDNYGGGKKIILTDSFAPLVLRQSIGLFAMPVTKPEFSVDSRLGIGAWETFIQGGYYVDDNDATPDLVELRQMVDSVQIGGEFSIKASGIVKEHLTYGLSAYFMQPFFNDTDLHIAGIDLMNMMFEASVGVALWEFLSVNYSFKAEKQPLLIDKWQIQNSLMVSIGINLPRPAPIAQEPYVCPVCEKTEEEVKNETPEDIKNESTEQTADESSLEEVPVTIEEKTASAEDNTASDQNVETTPSENAASDLMSDTASTEESVEPAENPAPEKETENP